MCLVSARNNVSFRLDHDEGVVETILLAGVS